MLLRAFRLAVASSLALSAVNPSRAGVLVVGPGQPFAAIQPAIDAAVDGDVVLVRPGTYPGGFTITAKSVSVLGDGANVVVGALCTVQGLAPGQTAVIANLLSEPATPGGIAVLDCAGSVRIMDVTWSGAFFASYAARVSNSDDVAIARSSGRGPSGSHAFEGGYAGLSVFDSRVALYDVVLEGGVGATAFAGGASGGSGLRCDQSIVFASGSTLRGGNSGNGGCSACGVPPGCPTGASFGGYGVLVGDASPGLSSVTLLGGAVIGGLRGSPGCGFPGGQQSAGTAGPSGAFVTLAGPARTLRAASLARESTPLALAFDGQPGDRALLVLTVAARWESYPPFQGILLYGNGPRRFPMGLVPGTGTLNATLALPDLGAGIESRLLHVQALFVDPSNAVTLGSPVSLTVVDGAF